MTFDLSRQAQEFEQLKEEFSRLSSQFDALLKSQGITAEFLEGEDLDNPPPEIKASLEAAKATARRAGEERKGRAQIEAQPQPRVSGQRRGAIRP
jgi:ElaB/YqjD/DUF883 family membrane-anchored ribosome-binding protein